MRLQKLSQPFPLVILFGFISLIVFLLLPSTRLSITTLWIVLSAVFLVTLAHETGHLIMARMQGLIAEEMIVGPIAFKFNNGSFQLRPNFSWLYFGGIVRVNPPDTPLSSSQLTKKFAFVWLAGPIASLFLGLAAGFILLAANEASLFVIILCAHSLGIGLVTSIPMEINGGMRSDGYNFLVLKRGGVKANTLISTLLLQKEYLSPRRPSEWNKAVIEQAIGSIHAKSTHTAANLNDEIGLRMQLYYHFMDIGQLDKALPLIEPVALSEKTPTQSPSRPFIDSFYITHLLLYSTGADRTSQLTYAESFVQGLSKKEPYSYHKAWAAFLSAQGDTIAAKEHLQQAAALLERWFKPFGIYIVEQRILSDIEHSMAYIDPELRPSAQRPVTSEIPS